MATRRLVTCPLPCNNHKGLTLRNTVGSCCVCLLVAKSLTGFKLCAKTPNNMQQGMQNGCNMSHTTMLRPFARGFTCTTVIEINDTVAPLVLE